MNSSDPIVPKSPRVAITETIEVQCAPERVWDFTQDYQRRSQWDSSVLEATVLNRDPFPRVRVRLAGGVRAVLQYKAFHRPVRTSLVMEEVQSFLLNGGGGSWSYAPSEIGTTWTQTNSLKLNPGILSRILLPMVRWQLRTATRRSMKKAKALLESGR